MQPHTMKTILVALCFIALAAAKSSFGKSESSPFGFPNSAVKEKSFEQDVRGRCCDNCRRKPQFQTFLLQSIAYAGAGNGSDDGVVQQAFGFAMSWRRNMSALQLFDPETHEKTSRLVMDYNKGVQYNITGDNCTEAPYPQHLPPMTLPDDAKFLGKFRLGGRYGVDAGRFQFSVDNSSMTATITRDCTPISSTVSMSVGSVDLFISQTFADYTPFIRTRGLFDIPDSCNDLFLF